jgi:hypothetical protein
MGLKDAFTRCEGCPRIFRTEDFAAHKQSHYDDDAEKLAESKANPYSSSSDFFEGHAPNLDATKNVGFMRREMNKFGSPVSRDRFDGESDS